MDHPELSRVVLMNFPLVFEGTPRHEIEPNGPIGSANDGVFGQWLGRSPQELAALRAEGVITGASRMGFARAATKWAFPMPFHRKPSRPVPSVTADALDSLTTLLIHDLNRGHYHVAIRHFLMLKASGGTVPALIERSCEQLMRECPASRREKIVVDVARWLDMTGCDSDLAATANR